MFLFHFRTFFETSLIHYHFRFFFRVVSQVVRSSALPVKKSFSFFFKPGLLLVSRMSNFDFEFESQDPSKEQDFGTRSFWENGVDNDDDDAGVNFEGTFGGLSTFSPVSASKSNQDFENQDFEMEDKQSFQNVAKSGKKQGYDSDSDIDADFAGGWDNAKNEAPFSDYETTNKFEYSTKRGDDMESFDGFDQSEPNDERFGSEFDKVSRKTGKRRMDSGNMSNVKSEFGSWKDAVEIDQRPVNDRE